MANIPAILIAVTGFSFFFYMTGYKGAIVIAVLATMLLGAIYFKQNALLYMPGMHHLIQSCLACLSPAPTTHSVSGTLINMIYKPSTWHSIHPMESLLEVGT